MNKSNIDFINTHNIDFTSFDTRIYTLRDINSILSQYEVQGKKVTKKVSFNDIVGFYEQRDLHMQFPDILDDFFDELGDSYHRRSVGLLSYDTDLLLNKLIDSYKIEPIKTLEADGKQVIFTDGMHRFVVLRLLFLNECSKCQTIDEYNAIKERFIIPVEATQIDLVKTYCKYLINTFNPAPIMGEYYQSVEKENDYYFLSKSVGWGRPVQIVAISESEYQDYLGSVIRLNSEYGSSYKPTSRSELKKFNGETLYLSDEELILFTKNMIAKSKRNSAELFEMIAKYDSLRNFVITYFSDLFDLERGLILNDNHSKNIQ